MARPTDYSPQGYKTKIDYLYDTFSIGNCFKNEKEMHSFIKNNANDFAKDFLGINLLKFEYEPIIRNKLIGRLKKAGILKKNHMPRPDFIFYGKSEEIWIVECKNKDNTCTDGISQLLLYKYFSKFPPKKTKYLLVSSIFEYIPFEMMTKVKIPLKICLLNKTHKAIYE